MAKELPKAPLPVTTLKTPGGRPASAQISAKSKAVKRVYVAGFNTTVLPMAKAGQTFQTSNIRGKFHGTIAPTTPTGFQSAKNFYAIHLNFNCLYLIKS